MHCSEYGVCSRRTCRALSSIKRRCCSNPFRPVFPMPMFVRRVEVRGMNVITDKNNNCKRQRQRHVVAQHGAIPRGCTSKESESQLRRVCVESRCPPRETTYR